MYAEFFMSFYRMSDVFPYQIMTTFMKFFCIISDDFMTTFHFLWLVSIFLVDENLQGIMNHGGVLLSDEEVYVYIGWSSFNLWRCYFFDLFFCPIRYISEGGSTSIKIV